MNVSVSLVCFYTIGLFKSSIRVHEGASECWTVQEVLAVREQINSLLGISSRPNAPPSPIFLSLSRCLGFLSPSSCSFCF